MITECEKTYFSLARSFNKMDSEFVRVSSIVLTVVIFVVLVCLGFVCFGVLRSCCGCVYTMFPKVNGRCCIVGLLVSMYTVCCSNPCSRENGVRVEDEEEEEEEGEEVVLLLDTDVEEEEGEEVVLLPAAEEAEQGGVEVVLLLDEEAEGEGRG